MIRRARILAGAVALLLSGGAVAAPVPPAITAALAGAKTVPGAIILIRQAGRPDRAYAIGVRAFGGAPLRADDEFRIASVTKTYVAAAALRLVEDGKLGLADKIASRLSAESVRALRAGGYDVDRITLAQLLAHRAGLRSHDTTEAFATAIGENPGRSWTRTDQIAIAMAEGKPLSPPGTRYAYSDTGYVLIGEIIERATGEALAVAVPRLLGFDRLGIRHSYWEPVPDGLVTAVPANRAHAYQDDIDTAPINPSFDIHGGGGLVATADDTLKFFAALTEGRVFRKPATLQAMLAPASQPVPAGEGLGYGFGIERFRIGSAICWGHKGHWSTIALWCPRIHTGYLASLNAAGDEAYRTAHAVFAATEKQLAVK